MFRRCLGNSLFLAAFLPLSALADSKDWDTKEFMQNVQSEIKRHWQPEKRKKSLRSLLRFAVRRNGSPFKVALVQASGDVSFDQEAVLTVLQCHFEPLPEKAPDQVDIEFTFDYKPQNNSTGGLAVSDTEVQTKAPLSDPNAEQNGFRLIHFFMRVLTPIITAFVLIVQVLMLIIFSMWFASERLKLWLGRRGFGAAGKAPGAKAHENENSS